MTTVIPMIGIALVLLLAMSISFVIGREIMREAREYSPSHRQDEGLSRSAQSR